MADIQAELPPRPITLRIRLSNGEIIEARTEEWIAAVLYELSDQQRTQVFERIRKKNVFYQTPGHYVLHAEPGRFR